MYICSVRDQKYSPIYCLTFFNIKAMAATSTTASKTEDLQVINRNGYFKYLSLSELKQIYPVFLELVKELKQEKKARAFFARSLASRISAVFYKIVESCNERGKDLPDLVNVADKYIRAELDTRRGERITALSLKDLKVGEGIAFKVRVSNTTGKCTYNISTALPIFPCTGKLLTNLAKKRVSDSAYFATCVLTEDKVLYTTVYQAQRVYTQAVDESGELLYKKNGEPKMVCSMIRAVKVDNMIKRFSTTESAFKKGISNALTGAIVH